jgi:hypothetical protein
MQEDRSSAAAPSDMVDGERSMECNDEPINQEENLEDVGTGARVDPLFYQVAVFENDQGHPSSHVT